MTGRRTFLDENFLLEGESARRLYREHAATAPIIDYHCHLPPAEIAANRQFANLTQVWLAGDHYKWRAMRANGIPERRITGDASDEDKFRAWAETVPYTIGNPLYHWTHLELARYFGIEELLGPESADRIYGHCSDLLAREEYRARGLIERMGVKVVCTTDDPCDSLEHHDAIQRDGSFRVRVVPAFRPDRAHAIENPKSFGEWVGRLEQAAARPLRNFDAFLDALKERHDYFQARGARLSDHGIEAPVAESYTKGGVAATYRRVRTGTEPTPREAAEFRSCLLFELARMDAEAGWTMQLHMGAIRSVNSRMLARLGRDTGYDSIGDFRIALPLARFLDRLDANEQLPKMILYCLNPADNDVVAAMIGSFQDGSVPGKIQFGSGWWFNDQKDGMERQLTTLANQGLLSRFVGMLTDSRSFLSYPRHEYFRRVLCNLVGGWVDRGEAPADFELLGRMVQDICYNNARSYFGFEVD